MVGVQLVTAHRLLAAARRTSTFLLSSMDLSVRRCPEVQALPRSSGRVDRVALIAALDAVITRLKAANVKRRIIRVQFQHVIITTGKREGTAPYEYATHHFTLPTAVVQQLPVGQGFIGYDMLIPQLQAAIPAIRRFVEMGAVTAADLEGFEAFLNRSPFINGRISAEAIPQAGVPMAQAPLGASDMFGYMVCHPHVGVQSSFDNKQLKLTPSALELQEPYHIPGDQDCMVYNLAAMDMKARFKNYGRDTVLEKGRFLSLRPDVLQTGISPYELKDFAENMKVAMYVLNIRGGLVAKHVPASLSKNGQKSIYLLAHSGHATLLDKDTNSLCQKIHEDDAVPKPSAKCSTPGLSGFAQSKMLNFSDMTFCKNIEEVEHEIGLGTTVSKVHLHYSGNIVELFAHFLQNHKYEAKVHASHFNITGIDLHIMSAVYQIRICKDSNEQQLCFVDQKEYYLAGEHMYEMQTGLMNENSKSQYAPSVRRAFDAYRMGALVKCTPDAVALGIAESTGFDCVRAYPAILCEMKNLPVFSAHDEFMEWDGTWRADAFYLVENRGKSIRENILCHRRYGILQGHVLMHARVDFLVIGELQPSRLHSNPAPNLLKTLYADPGLPDSKKKLIPNIIIGQMTRRVNTAERYMFSRHSSEVVELCGKDVSRLVHSDHTTLGWIGRTAYAETLMEQGWLPIGLAIYHRMRLRLLQAYDTLTQLGKTVVGFQTDCIQALNLDGRELPCTTTKTFEDMGKWHREKSKFLVQSMLEFESNELVIEPQQWLKQKTVDELLAAGHEGKGGSGKTFGLRERMKENSAAVLWVAPSEKRLQEFTEHGFKHTWTVAHLIGWYIKCGQVSFKENLPNLPGGVDTIIVDEIFQLDLLTREHLLSRLLELGLQCYYTGDPGQTSFDSGFFQQSAARQEHALAKVFAAKHIHTHDHRRLTVEDANLIAKVETLLKQDGANVRKILIEHFQCTEDKQELLKYGTHLVVTNFTGAWVNSTVGEWKAGMELVVRKHEDKCPLINHTIVRVDDVGPVKVRIGDIWYPRKFFRPARACTIASTQGDTINKPYVIWDAFMAFTKVESLITALGRCRRVTDIHIYTGKCDIDWTPIARRIQGNLASDKKESRRVSPQAQISLDWLKTEAQKSNLCCALCHRTFLLSWDEETEGDSVSVDRKKSYLGHCVGNCQLVHLSCNHSKQDLPLS